jgi:hypothetical protein
MAHLIQFAKVELINSAGRCRRFRKWVACPTPGPAYRLSSGHPPVKSALIAMSFPPSYGRRPWSLLTLRQKPHIGGVPLTLDIKAATARKYWREAPMR